MIDHAGILIAQDHPIACDRVEGSNDNMSKSHYHTHYELYFLEHGNRTHMMNNEMYQTTAGNLMLFAPYVMHHSYSEDDVNFKRIVLYFQESSVHSPELLNLLTNGSGLYILPPKLARTIHTFLIEMLKVQKGTEYLREAALDALLNNLLVTLMQGSHVSEKPAVHNCITQVIDYIEQNYMKEINLKQLASLFYISEYYLCHEFRKYTNRTIIQYINATRILNAQRQIMETNETLTTIATNTGFSSLTHFNRTFKSIMGMSPSAFRKINTEKTQPSKSQKTLQVMPKRKSSR